MAAKPSRVESAGCGEPAFSPPLRGGVARSAGVVFQSPNRSFNHPVGLRPTPLLEKEGGKRIAVDFRAPNKKVIGASTGLIGFPNGASLSWSRRAIEFAKSFRPAVTSTIGRNDLRARGAAKKQN